MSTAIIDAKLYASFFLIYQLMKTFTAVKVNEAVEKRIWKISNNNINSHSIKWAIYNVHKHYGSETVQYGLEIIFKGDSLLTL